MPKPSLSEIAVFTGRKELVDALKNAVKSLKIKNLKVETEEDQEKFLAKIAERREVLVVADLERGLMPVMKVLKEEAKIENRYSRPSILFAVEISDNVVELATEFLVSQVHTGPLSEGSVEMALGDLIKELETVKEIQEQLVQVSIAREQDEWEDALEILQDLKYKFPDNERIKSEIAENMMYADDWPAAFEILDPIIKEGSKNPRVMNMMGRCLLKVGKIEEAAKVLETAHILNPFNVDRLLELGNIYTNLGKNSEAKEKFEEAMDIDPENKEAKLGAAQSSLLDGDINEGLMLMRQVANKRELASIFNTAGILCARNKQLEKAIGLYDAALKALDGNEKLQGKLFFNVGVAHYRQGDRKKALSYFEQAIQADSALEKARKNAQLLGSSVVAAPAASPSTAAASAPADDLDEEDEFL